MPTMQCCARRCGPDSPWRNRNVVLILSSGFWYYCANGLALEHVFSMFVFLVAAGSNFVVGLTGMIASSVQLLLAIPAGCLADRISRQKTLIASACVGLVAAGLLLAAFVTTKMPLVYAGLVAIGAFGGMNAPAAEAIFSDSVATGPQRTHVFTINFALRRLSGGIGPLIAVVLFACLGNEWTLPECRVVLLTGAALLVVAVSHGFFFSDKLTLGHESEAIIETTVSNSSSSSTEAETAIELSQPLTTAAVTDTLSDTKPKKTKKVDLWCPGRTFGERCVPILITMSDLIIMSGAGMTIKFFSLFMASLGVKPMLLSLLYFVEAASIAGCSLCSTAIARKLGRVPCILVSKILATACLWGVAFLLDPWIIGPLWILRSSLMNSILPLEKSVLMDYVPKRNRAKWSSILALSSFSWSGSALLGGWLIDKTSYKTAFFITAIIYVFGAMPFIPMLWIVPRKETPPFAEQPPTPSITTVEEEKEEEQQQQQQ